MVVLILGVAFAYFFRWFKGKWAKFQTARAKKKKLEKRNTKRKTDGKDIEMKTGAPFSLGPPKPVWEDSKAAHPLRSSKT